MHLPQSAQHLFPAHRNFPLGAHSVRGRSSQTVTVQSQKARFQHGSNKVPRKFKESSKFLNRSGRKAKNNAPQEKQFCLPGDFLMAEVMPAAVFEAGFHIFPGKSIAVRLLRCPGTCILVQIDHRLHRGRGQPRSESRPAPGPPGAEQIGEKHLQRHIVAGSGRKPRLR